jgi:hypothetical protein
MNGLIYSHQNLCQAVIKNTKYVENLFNLFDYQFPIALHEDAIHCCLNIIMNASK